MNKGKLVVGSVHAVQACYIFDTYGVLLGLIDMRQTVLIGPTFILAWHSFPSLKGLFGESRVQRERAHSARRSCAAQASLRSRPATAEATRAGASGAHAAVVAERRQGARDLRRRRAFSANVEGGTRA
jgi:hypothetical protein